MYVIIHVIVLANIAHSYQGVGGPGFMEKGVRMYKAVGFVLLILFHFIKYPMKMKYFGLTAGAGVGSSETPLDPPLTQTICLIVKKRFILCQSNR